MSKRDRIYWAAAVPSAGFLSWLLLELTPSEPWLISFSLYCVMFLGLFTMGAYLGKSKRRACAKPEDGKNAT